MMIREGLEVMEVKRQEDIEFLMEIFLGFMTERRGKTTISGTACIAIMRSIKRYKPGN